MIYITGGNGWLGLNIIKSIIKGKAHDWGLEDDKLSTLILPGSSKKEIYEISDKINIHEGNILNTKELDDFLSEAEGSILFHTVGIIHPKRVSEFFEINRDGTRNLLDSSIKAGLKKVIIMSSNSPIGCNDNKTDLFDESSDYNPYMNYGKSKMETQRFINKKFDLKSTEKSGTRNYIREADDLTGK